MSEDIAAPAPIDFSVASPAAVAPAPAVASAPIVAEVAAPAVEAAPVAPVVVEPPAVETPAVVAPSEPVAAETKPAEKADTPKAPERPKTLLEKADEAAAAKEAAAKVEKDGEKDDEDAKPADEKAKSEDGEKALDGEILPLDFEIPANLKAVPEQMAAFSDLLRSTKTGDLKASGQKLLDMHSQALDSFAKQYVQQASEDQWKVWNDLIATKEKEVLADPIVGGAGHETAKAAVVRMRDLGVPEGDRAQFSEMLNVTGVGSWPPFWRMLHRFAEIFDEPPMPLPGGKPPKDAHIQAPSGKFALLHDHPTSQAKRD